MANYECSCKTNCFRVTDENRYNDLFARLCSHEGELYDLTETTSDGIVYHKFGAYGTIGYSDPETTDPNLDEFIEKLQSILPDNEAFIYIETGHEKLNYVSGTALVVTNKKVQYIDLADTAIKTAKKLLNDPCFNTRLY